LKTTGNKLIGLNIFEKFKQQNKWKKFNNWNSFDSWGCWMLELKFFKLINNLFFRGVLLNSLLWMVGQSRL